MSLSQITSHDGDLRHTVKNSVLQKGYQIAGESELSLVSSSPPHGKKRLLSRKFTMGKNVAYDCVDYATNLNNVPQLLM